ncbi:hypothetical protein DL766_006619 [Monosporascus sp. MC13-8B]|uniref:DNA-binding protein RAP1 n=1 Tax=Monosporascus cannonballus TaxID=155416 RepID=A0ABY0HF46_9PEZI|nr:hypothetical protein DL762_001854 [Monosporascus cannonballus]RYO98300.1 hypothetical protein DL763_002311 [Monosporascus cannonballus]RYP26709.1 hypothetical protein DL766_006619 [Monosporascus sp. MC13-8B]
MPAPIVYEGVAAQNGGGGTLFNGLKFWVSQRIPARSTCIQNIKSNGGEVVPIEKNADYLIADHARQDVPPGSYSWKFIDDCLEAGTLKPIEDYLCTEAPRKPRPVGSSIRQKGTRTPYTAEDDQILFKWVAKHEKLGVPVMGTSIYQALEAKYPHHTWQSWQSRWKDKLRYLPRPETSDGEPSPRPSPVPSQSATSTATSRPPGVRQTAAQNPGNSITRNPFTAEEDELLLQHVRQSLLEGKSMSGYKTFSDLAQDFPQHTMHSWRDRWVKTLKPRLEAAGSEWAQQVPRRRVSMAPRASRGVGQQELRQEEEPSAEEPPARGTVREVDEGEDQDDHEYQQYQPGPPHRSAEISPPMRNLGVHQGNTAEDRPQHPIFPDENRAGSEGASSTQAEVSDLKKQFNLDYQAYADASELQPHWWPSIKGKSFELWDLWRAVAAQKLDPVERDWQQISETLGFNWVEDESIPDEVRRCYEMYLADFEAALMDFDNNSDEEGETQSRDKALSGSPMPSSPPALRSTKRSFARALGSNHPYPNSSPPKRARYGRDSEIPSTPDEKNGTSHLRRHTLPAATAHHTPSPTARSTRGNMDMELPPQRPVVEPETQDFRFDPDTQAVVFGSQVDDEVESQDSITPSQQLLLESDARSEEIPGTPTPVRRVRGPFLQDESDGPDDGTPRAPGVEPSNAPPLGSDVAKPTRRSLPKSWVQHPSPIADRTAQSQPRQQVRSSQPTARDPSLPAQPQPSPKVLVKESPEDIIDFYMSLGYAHDIVVRALDATTWVPGLASQIMEMLKKGESIPSNWRGVWTKKDDEMLTAVYEDSEPQDAKEKRKRERQREKLERKHTITGMNMRVKFLDATGA